MFTCRQILLRDIELRLVIRVRFMKKVQYYTMAWHGFKYSQAIEISSHDETLSRSPFSGSIISFHTSFKGKALAGKPDI